MREKNRLHEFDCIRMTIYAVSLLSLLCFFGRSRPSGAELVPDEKGQTKR